jgi:hypothetical protein
MEGATLRCALEPDLRGCNSGCTPDFRWARRLDLPHPGRLLPLLPQIVPGLPRPQAVIVVLDGSGPLLSQRRAATLRRASLPQRPTHGITRLDHGETQGIAAVGQHPRHRQLLPTSSRTTSPPLRPSVPSRLARWSAGPRSACLAGAGCPSGRPHLFAGRVAPDDGTIHVSIVGSPAESVGA